MSEEKLKILELIKNGKLTPSEGLDLLEALNINDTEEAIVTRKGLENRFLRIRVDDAKTKVNVNVPLNLLKVTGKFVQKSVGLIPEQAKVELEKKGIDITKIDFIELINLIDEGLVDGKLVDVDTDDEHHGRTKVEIYVD